jgi:hypothetical protein
MPVTAVLPALPLDVWEASKITLHLYLQIVGKIRLTLHPKLNHWWHVTLYPSARGLTTGVIPVGNERLELAFDFIEHQLAINTSRERRVIALKDGLTVAAFYDAVMTHLRELGIDVTIVAKPFDPARVGSDIPFAEDNQHASYDPEYVNRFWRMFAWVDGVFREFQGRFYGKSTPVHLFWHSMDLVVTRFSGRAAPMEADSPVEREAYSHEVLSFGFWAGDANVPAPAFYAYAYPEPAGLRDEPLAPAAAAWTGEGGAMALLMYDDVREAADARADVLAFLESAYQAGAKRANWDTAALTHNV